MLMAATVLLAILNIHDLMAVLSGIQFSLPRMVDDPQLALVEVPVPVLQAISFVLVFLAFRLQHVLVEESKEKTSIEAYEKLLILGPVILLLASIINASQVYTQESGGLQALQHLTTLPYVIGTTLLCVDGIFRVILWPREAKYYVLEQVAGRADAESGPGAKLPTIAVPARRMVVKA
eukprot:jgi/Mesen1/3522/ME000197S02553